MNALKGLREDIIRHIDGVDDVKYEWDIREICEFCNERWELWEDGDEKGLPVCCDKAVKEAKCEAHLKELNGERK